MAKIILDVKDETKAILDKFVADQTPKATMKEVVLKGLTKLIPELNGLD